MKPIKYISSKAIIAKLLRDLNIQRTDFINDAVEWTGESLDAIGSFAQTTTDYRITKSSSHRTPVPRGTISINSMYYAKKEIPDGETPVREDFDYQLPYGSVDRHPAWIPEDSEHPVTVDRSKHNEDFVLDDGYIRTSFESDWIMFTYQKVKVDEDGFPKVPDTYEFRQAIYWYIVYKMMEGGMKHPAGINYLQAEERWLKYCQQARNDANMPSVSEMERFKDMWVGLLPPKAFDQYESTSDNAVDADNLIVDTFQRYSISD